MLRPDWERRLILAPMYTNTPGLVQWLNNSKLVDSKNAFRLIQDLIFPAFFTDLRAPRLLLGLIIPTFRSSRFVQDLLLSGQYNIPTFPGLTRLFVPMYNSLSEGLAYFSSISRVFCSRVGVMSSYSRAGPWSGILHTNKMASRAGHDLYCKTWHEDCFDHQYAHSHLIQQFTAGSIDFFQTSWFLYFLQ